MEPITLRGEHLINLYRYAHEPSYRLMFGPAEGYTAQFAARHDAIMQQILDSPDQPVRVVAGCDALCLQPPCPKYDQAICTAPDLLAKDRQTAATFGVEVGTTYAARELMHRLNQIPEGEAPH